MLYDCPSEAFRSITDEEKHIFLTRLSIDYPVFADDVQLENSKRSDKVKEVTILTEKNSENKVSLRHQRPGILFSSTSWTADEDFKILLEALEGNLDKFFLIIWRLFKY